MKCCYSTLLLFILFMQSGIPQQASDYFPDKTGFIWNYELIPLDSLNNPVDSLTFFRVDSFTTVADYQGELANIILSKEGTFELIHSLPYSDSLFYHFSDTTADEYVQVGRIGIFLAVLDSILADSTFSFWDLLLSLEDWYPAFQFSSDVNQTYALISVDTSITYNSVDIPLRFEYLGTRLEDDTLDTEIGTFLCKKFFFERGLSYLIILPPPLPEITIPIAFFNDTVWIAPDNWVVQRVFPSMVVDLSIIGGDSITIPGLSTKITDNITGIEESENIPSGFILYQNYPNPFNPSTGISWQMTVGSRAIIKVYDILGNEVATLVDEVKPAGEHKVEFEGSHLPSGVYFYQLRAGEYIETKKMVLLR